ncbi:Do family serine endopeptidase [Ekhidna sp. MALMAid0563]|uniref:Do family serine endopeptidase n=1 Tax=Ekhidna sp. MALMAid0563 TaxID=3143937 RepID=UPI0032DF2ED3
MSKRSLILAMVFSSLFGGIVAVVGYSYLNPKEQIIHQTSAANPVSLTNYVFDSADFVVPEGLNFVFAAKNATPSVVHIRTSYRDGMRANSPFNEFFKDYFGERYERREGPARGAGSGVVISSDGYIVTNNHVIENADEIEVVLNDNRSYQAKVVGVDENTDLAVLSIDEENLVAINYGDSEKINIGEWVLAIGNPYEFRSTVTAGIVSAKGRNINILNGSYRIESFIQTDAAVNPGNSGGALVNLNGELVGINTAIASPSGAFAGYSFAVPVSLVKKVTSDLIEYGTVQRALLGIQIGNVDAQLAEEYDLDVLRGVYVSGVVNGGAADKAGIEDGDVIIALDEKPVNNVAQLQERVAIKRPGDEVNVTFMRDGKKRVVKAKLRNEEGTMDIVELAADFRIEGATFVDVSDDLADRLGIDGGVQIKELGEGKWRDVRMKEGFIITGIDNEEIRNIRDLENYFKRPRRDGILIEGVYPDGSKAHYGLGL